MARRIAVRRPGRTVVALEPASNLFEHLVRNTAEFPNVTPVAQVSHDLLKNQPSTPLDLYRALRMEGCHLEEAMTMSKIEDGTEIYYKAGPWVSRWSSVTLAAECGCTARAVLDPEG